MTSSTCVQLYSLSSTTTPLLSFYLDILLVVFSSPPSSFLSKINKQVNHQLALKSLNNNPLDDTFTLTLLFLFLSLYLDLTCPTFFIPCLIVCESKATLAIPHLCHYALIQSLHLCHTIFPTFQYL
jgi:hypothetical protein